MADVAAEAPAAPATDLGARIEAEARKMATEMTIDKFTELSMKMIRQRLGATLGQELKAKAEKKMVKAAVEKILELEAASSPGEERRDSAEVFTQPHSPGDGSGGGAGANGAPGVAARYRCVKKAALRQSADLSSSKIGTLQPGQTIAVLESCTVTTSGGSLVRVRSERGWSSILSTSGNELLVPDETASASPGAAAADGEDAEAAKADAEVSPSSAEGRKRRRLSMSALAVSDDESDDDDDVLPAAAPAVEWVQCEHDSCGKWRRLPPDIKADELPDSWTCSMNTWNKEQASCDAPQEAEHEAQEAAAAEQQESLGAARKRSARNKSSLTVAQRKAVERLKTRSTLEALGDDDDDSSDEEEPEAPTRGLSAADLYLEQSKGGVALKRPGDQAESEAKEPDETEAKKPRRAAANTHVFYDDAVEQRRLAARKAMPHRERLLLEDDEGRLRRVLAREERRGEPAGIAKVARGLARLQQHAQFADPALLSAAQRCVSRAAEREGLAMEAKRLESKGELRQALQTYQLATEGIDMTLKPGLANHLKMLEQKVFDMGVEAWQPGSEAAAGGKSAGEEPLPAEVRAFVKTLKAEAIALKKAGKREEAKAKLREMNAAKERARQRSGAAPMPQPAPQPPSNASAAGAAGDDIDWSSVDFDALYQQKTVRTSTHELRNRRHHISTNDACRTGGEGGGAGGRRGLGRGGRRGAGGTGAGEGARRGQAEGSEARDVLRAGTGRCSENKEDRCCQISVAHTPSPSRTVALSASVEEIVSADVELAPRGGRVGGRIGGISLLGLGSRGRCQEFLVVLLVDKIDRGRLSA